MKLITLHLLSALSLLSFTLTAQKLKPSVLKQLDKVETDMFNAISEGDSASFKKLAGTDYYSINADGVDMKLKATLSNMLKFKGSTVKLSKQQQRMYGNFILRNGKAVFYFGEQPMAEVLYTTGWVFRNSKWQYVHWQGTLTGMSLQNADKTQSKNNSIDTTTTKKLQHQFR